MIAVHPPQLSSRRRERLMLVRINNSGKKSGNEFSGNLHFMNPRRSCMEILWLIMKLKGEGSSLT